MNKTAKSGRYYQNMKEAKKKKENNSKNEPTMKLIHSSTSIKSVLVYIYLFQDGYFKGHLQDKAMQEMSEAMDNELRKSRARLGRGIIN